MLTAVYFFYVLTNKRLVGKDETALGPALYASIHIAARVPGSQVILSTDGVANIGLGHLTDPISSESIKFYKDLASFAQSRGYDVILF